MWNIVLSENDKNEILKHPECKAVFFFIEKNVGKYTWDELWFAGKKNEAGLESFLSISSDMGYFSINKDEWFRFITLKKEIIESGVPTVITSGPINPPLVPTPGKGSAWYEYSKKLKEKGFAMTSIEKIELSARKIVSQLSSATEQFNPVKGMVVGNVQSGKTANMAGVISMAADYGYNFFIVLSGTIENLRIQTQKRLMSDLSSGSGDLSFYSLDNVSLASPAPNRLQDLKLDEGDKQRYLAVCLKNSSRLKNLLKWLCNYPNNKQKLKILVIDDEADQAGINTASYEKNLKTAICKLIESVVFGSNYKGENDYAYKCMNYIGYTATPYANFLNTSIQESLYPKNFIVTLPSSDEYFGPKQIFGLPENDENTGLSIINRIDDDEVENIKNWDVIKAPKQLSNSIIWFLCTVVLFRKWKMEQPVSMLIHTSQKNEDHKNMMNMIQNFFIQIKKVKKDDMVCMIKEVWDEQTSKFNKTVLLNEYRDYSVKEEEINDFPEFEDIVDDVVKLLVTNLKYIMLDDDDSLVYTDGVHLCVDNCYNNMIEDGNHLRIVYPDPQTDLEIRKKCPAFIIIGGSTLSRGLTLEGLTVSYFLRGATQADTLMQMGRWFGYRKKYEVLPRIWLSDKTKYQFEYLAKLDEDLRDELKKMQILNQTPSDYAVRIDRFPAFVYLKITAAKKMQNAIQADFSNHRGQTTKLFADEEIINENLCKTINFINKLGKDDNQKLVSNNNPLLNDNSRVWVNVDYGNVLDYLKSLVFPKQSSIVQDYESMKIWFDEQYKNKVIDNWNIVLSGVNKSESKAYIDFDNFKLYLGTRSKIKDNDDSIINLKTITRPSDHFIDIDCNGLDTGELNNVKKGFKDYQMFRFNHGLANTPLLIIYIIDKDSQPKIGENRLPLNTNNHVVGYDIYIPSDSKECYETKVAVRLEKYIDAKDDE